MATYDYEIANLAMVRLGANRITSLTDGTKNANEVNAIYTLIRDEIMRDHAWGFATRYQYLMTAVANVLTVSAITKANPGVVTYTGTDPEDGDLYKADSIGGMVELEDNYYVVNSVNTVANTFALYDEYGDAVNTSAYTVYTAGGTFTRVVPENDAWTYVYTLPSRVLKVIEINDDPDEDFEVVENRYLLTNSEECLAKFITTVTDVTKYDQTFVDVFAWRLAAEVCMAITGDSQKANYIWQQYRFALANGKAIDASQGRTLTPKDNRYKNARR